MGTTVLPARDFLAHYQSHSNAHLKGLIYPKKSQQYPQSKRKSGHGNGSSPQKSKVKGEIPEKKPPLKPKPQEESFPEVGKRAVNRIHKGSDRKVGHVDDQAFKKEPAKDLPLMGKFTILKRGQTLMPNNNGLSQLEIVSKTTGQVFVSLPEFLCPDPTLFLKDQIPDLTLLLKNQTLKLRSVSSKQSDASTSPGLENETTEGGNSLKTPNFPVFNLKKWAGPAFANYPCPSSLPYPNFSKKKYGQDAVEIDRFATRDLRCLLGLD